MTQIVAAAHAQAVAMADQVAADGPDDPNRPGEADDQRRYSGNVQGPLGHLHG